MKKILYLKCSLNHCCAAQRKGPILFHVQAAATYLAELILTAQVFLKGAPQDLGHIIPSELALEENWSPVMASGDLTGAKAWLLKDLKTSAVQRDRFYVMQANPNNAEEKMYERMNANSSPASNLDFLEKFLQDLPALILQAAHEEPRIQINVIDSDFLNISNPYATAMELMMPTRALTEGSTGLTGLGFWILGLLSLCGLLACTAFLARRSRSNGYDHRFANDL